MKSPMLLMPACLTALTACASMNGSAPAPALAPADRYVHQIDIPATVRPYLSPQGFLDPAFPPTVATPSRTLSDFYGNQAIADVPAARILADFVPRHASLVSQDANSLTLRFQRGYTATFYPNSAITVMGATGPYSHVTISGEDWRAQRANLADFLNVLERTRLARRYLLPNPFYEDEVATAAQKSGGRHANVTVDAADAAAFLRTPDAILLLPEGVHGQRRNADELMQLLGRGQVDWVGLEMLPTEMQPVLDTFHEAAPDSDAFRQARQRLIDYFAEAWNGRAGPRTTGEENYYFQLVETAGRRGARVIALEEANMLYILFRFGEAPFGGAVRSYQWSKAVPRTGRGVLFGGSAHFNMADPVNVQDFIAARQPNRPILSLRDLRARPQS